MVIRIVVDQDVCVGSGNCVRLADDVFDQDEELGVVVLRLEVPEPAREAVVRRAAATCPTRAITIVES